MAGTKKYETQKYEVSRCWHSTGERSFSKTEARRLLGIKTRYTFNECLRTLDLYGRGRYTMSELAEVLKLQLFLQAGHGSRDFSHSSYSRLRRHPKLLEATLRTLKINVEQALVEKLNYGYA